MLPLLTWCNSVDEQLLLGIMQEQPTWKKIYLTQSTWLNGKRICCTLTTSLPAHSISFFSPPKFYTPLYWLDASLEWLNAGLSTMGVGWCSLAGLGKVLSPVFSSWCVCSSINTLFCFQAQVPKGRWQLEGLSKKSTAMASHALAMMLQYFQGCPGVSVGWGRLEVSRVSLSIKRSGLPLVAQLKQHRSSETPHSNIEAPGWLNFNSPGRPLVLRWFPLVIELQEAKQQETSVPYFEGTHYSAVGHISAFIPDPRCQQPFLVCLGFVPCARTNLASWPVHTWEDHVTVVMWRQRSRMVKE